MNSKEKKPSDKSANHSDTKFKPGVSGNPDGNETFLTPKVQEAICARLRAGAFFSDACTLNDIRPDTARKWMLRGRKDEEPYKSFHDAVLKAEAENKVWGTGLIMSAAEADPKNYQAIFKLFALRYPKEWRETKDVELSGKNGGPIAISLTEIDSAIDGAMNAAEMNADDESDEDSDEG